MPKPDGLQELKGACTSAFVEQTRPDTMVPEGASPYRGMYVMAPFVSLMLVFPAGISGSSRTGLPTRYASASRVSWPRQGNQWVPQPPESATSACGSSSLDAAGPGGKGVPGAPVVRARSLAAGGSGLSHTIALPWDRILLGRAMTSSTMPTAASHAHSAYALVMIIYRRMPTCSRSVRRCGHRGPGPAPSVRGHQAEGSAQ